MDQQYVDLHCHSTASDGTLSPTAVVRLAKETGLVGLALTDHDTTAGLAEAAAEAARLSITFIPGIEISCQIPSPGTLHMLGYGVDAANPGLLDLSHQLIAMRDGRNVKIVAKLRDLGLDITLAEVEAEAGGDVVGRPHFAAILVRKGYVSALKQAFDKYLGRGGAAYFDKERADPQRAIGLIRQAGGVTVLAHPVQLRTTNDAQLQRIVKDLVDMGLAGLEVYHSDHSPDLVRAYTQLADRFGLIKTGGSDFHGENKKSVHLGSAAGQRIPRQVMDALLDRISALTAGRAL